MDLQACLKTILRNKYQKLKDKISESPSIPLRLSYRKIKQELSKDDLQQHEFRRFHVSELPRSGIFRYDPVPDLLSCECNHSNSKKTVLTIGVSGIGKTTVVQSWALEWAEKGCFDIRCLFPFTFWELNLIQHKLSLTELLQEFYPELEKLDASSLNDDKVWFVFDGLDEFKRQINFSCPAVSDVSETCTVDTIIANLIRGNLLPRAHIWITTRYSAVMQIPDCYLLKETEVLGFTDKQKEQHFQAIIRKDKLTHKAIDHVKITNSLNILCQIPPICTIVANVLKDHLEENDGYKINPLSLTQIYALGSKMLDDYNSDILSKLKKLALLWIGEGNVIYEDDLLKMDISVEEASDFTEECPFVLRQETGLHGTTVFRFGHSSIQEFLAASAKLDEIEGQEISLGSSCCQSLVDEQLNDPDGKYDVFLRFIFGLIKERHLFEPTDKLFLHTTMMVFKYFFSPAGVSLFYCLREHNSQALVSEVKYCQRQGFAPNPEYTSMHWDLLLERMKNIDGLQENFELKASERCDEKLLRHLPDIYKSRKAMLRFSNLTDKCCPALASVLSTNEVYLRELDLGYNSISDDGVKDLVEGLSDQSCRLKVLRLQGCRVTAQACQHLAKALKQTQKMQELDLGCNEIGDEGLRYLSAGLRDADCWLETLKLSQCNIKEKGCCYLASSLQQNSDHLKNLDLSINEIGNKGASQLFEKFNISNLHKLEMYHCGLTELSCSYIRDALNLESSTLVELNLSNNSLKDAGFKLICEGMYAWCSLERLNVSRCGITGKGCPYLAKVLCSVSQLYSGVVQKTEWQAVELRDVDLSMNCLGDSGVKEISNGLRNPISHLKTLNLSHCSLTDECCAELAAGLGCQENISELDLSGNYLQDKGVKKLCMGLKSPLCILN
ncbi:NACHT, LRR and PYD domains-containing protein 12-like isoform X2 [Melanotaenia boesemani]|uniref:NACHT, LRR and PYD domains-containing protein 12-like isoform X2 n=1 Tax=Melanotaenia boesemani TaxID=1250792 RepID=UPI001C05CB36|nr:NACHT, LRR and PYD domains-containing protein 12-like isoform X2 [Melanotaenia boesemani]